MTDRRTRGGRIPPAEVFPARYPGFRARWLELPANERVRVVESGPPDGDAVVLIPGWAAPAYVFRHLLADLGAAGYRALAIELRGHGLSDKPEARAMYSTEAIVEHAAEAINALRLDSLVLGGHSLGCAIALRALPRIAARVRGLILLSPVGLHGRPRPLLMNLLRNRLVEAVAPYVVGRWVVRLVLRMAAARGGIYSRRDVDEYWAPSQFREFAPAMLALLRDFDWGEEDPVDVAALTWPALVLYGTRDPLMTRTRTIAALRDSAVARVIPLRGTGHIVSDEEPEKLAVAVRDFLATLPG